MRIVRRRRSSATRRHCRWRLIVAARPAIKTGEVDRHAVGDQFGEHVEDRARGSRSGRQAEQARCGRPPRI